MTIGGTVCSQRNLIFNSDITLFVVQLQNNETGLLGEKLLLPRKRII